MPKIIGNTTATPLDAYTKKEIDNKFGGVYRFCGSASVELNNNEITAYPQRAGDVYNIATGGRVTQGAKVSIPIISIDGNYMVVENNEFANILVITAEEPDCFIGIGQKGSTANFPVIITNVKIEHIDENNVKLTFGFSDSSPNREIDINTQEIVYMDYSFELQSGDNVVWTGHYWDKLSASVDTSNFATKDEIPKPFELIDSDTLSQDVVTIVPTMNGNYKELYVLLTMPTTNADNSNDERCRINLMSKNKALFQFPAPFIQHYTVDWCAAIHMQMLGNQFKTNIWHTEKLYFDRSYGVPPDYWNYSGATSLGKLDNPYVDYVEILMSSPNSGRVFPEGTTYELWGVKA